MYLLDLFDERREKGQSDLVYVECVWMIGLMVVMLMSYSHVVSVVLGFLGTGLHSKFPALFSFRNFAKNV